MSDDLAPQYLASRVTDTELDADLARLKESRSHNGEQGFVTQVGQSMADTMGKDDMLPGDSAAKAGRFLMNLPKNITVGVMDAGLAAIHFMNDVGKAGAKAAGATDEQAALTPSVMLPGMLIDAGRQLRGELAKGSDTSDQIVQSAAQFFLPFAGYMKMAGAGAELSAGANVARGLLAESATVATAFEPHEARFSDLLRLTDPQNHLVNTYIDYMAADKNEGEWEGRFKNVLDNLVVSAGIGSVIWAGGKTLRAAKNGELIAAPKVGKSSQRGAIGALNRKPTAEMSVEELRKELLTHELSGIPNRRAYQEAPRKAIQASIDVDSLKAVNDQYGHEAGDALLREAAASLKAEGIEVYHVSGDEFVAQGDDSAALTEALQRANDRLASANLPLPARREGDKKTVSGVSGLSFGVGKDLSEAEAQLQANKAAREKAGKRAARGQQPPTAIEVTESPRERRKK